MKKCAGCKKKSCDGCSLKPGGAVQSNKEKGLVLPGGFSPSGQKGYGIAFDIGTTTLAGMLWNLEKGELLEGVSCVNPQRIAGSDVVSRITWCREGEENRKRLRQVLVEKLDELAEELCILTGIGEKEKIEKAVLVGNTAMCEIFLGLPLEGLMKAPFHKAYTGRVTKKGKDFSFSFLKDTVITVLPSIEGYVGADALAVYTYIRRLDDRKNILAVDIGTNGEILLAGEKASYACSAAAGPALEGAAVSYGMGAAPGAIEKVDILGNFPRQDIVCRVIGETPPKGICGSGLVDALAVLKKLRVLQEDGYLLSAGEARKKGVPELVCRRLSTLEGENRILLTDEKAPVYLLAGDIRQLQLAKGAIRAGIEILLQKEGIGQEELSHIYLAGSFGSYIQIENAVEIGLLPDVTGITHTGNCAGTGAAMALLEEGAAEEMEILARQIRHVELAREENFQQYFLNHMALQRR